MVTPEGTPPKHGDKAVDLSQQQQQQRKSLMAAAIRRGEVKISEPILWVEPVSAVVEQQGPVTPTTEEAGPGEATTHGLAISTDEAAHVVNNTNNISSGSPGNESVVEQRPSVLDVGREGVVSQATVIPATPTTERKRSIFVEDDMVSPSPTAMEKKKVRRSSTLRTVLRSVFGRKKKRQSKDQSPPPSRSGVKHEHSRSDPVSSIRPKHSPEAEHTRAMSTANAVQALREVELEGPRESRVESRQTPVQHMLPFPMNINAPHPDSPERKRERDAGNYLSFETSPQVHRRRATLPTSMVVSAEDSTMLHKLWSTTDLSPLGSASNTSHLGSLGLPSPPLDPTLTQTADQQPNRRSKSAGELHEMAKRQERSAHLRNMSAEIEQWRKNRIEVQPDQRLLSPEEETTPMCSPRASSNVALTEVSEVLAETGSSVHNGDVGNTADLDSQIEEVTVPDTTSETGMAQRLAQLENTMHRLSMSFQEYATSQHEGQQQHVGVTLKSAPRTGTPQIAFAPPTPSRKASAGNLNIADAPQRNPSMRFTQPMHTIPSPSPSKGSSYQPSYHSTTSTAAAPASPQATYLQPHVAYPPGPSSVHSAPQTSSYPVSSYITQDSLAEHITPLYNALRYERQIRKALETQVSHLQKDVVELSALVAQMRKQAAYASQATIHGAALGGTRSPKRASPVRGFGSYLSGGGGGSGGTNGNGNGERSRFSGYDSTDEDSEVDAPLRSPQEMWTTPREEQNGMF